MSKITEERILDILAPMYEVTPEVEKSGVVALFKEGIKFGMIKDEAVHLVDTHGIFEKIADDVILDQISFCALQPGYFGLHPVKLLGDVKFFVERCFTIIQRSRSQNAIFCIIYNLG